MGHALILLELPEDVLAEILRDARLHGVWSVVVRDMCMRRGFVALRDRGYSVEAAIDVLGEQFGLSPLWIRAIVYREDDGESG